MQETNRFGLAEKFGQAPVKIMVTNESEGNFLCIRSPLSPALHMHEVIKEKKHLLNKQYSCGM